MKNIRFKTWRKCLLAALLLVGIQLPGLAQKIAIHGSVYDEFGDPMIGATVMEKGTTNGTATDLDGQFTINAPGNAVLVVSYVGYNPVEEPVNGRTELSITMQPNSQELSETVVIGYGTVKKKDATGSVAVVKPNEIEAGLATSAQDLLVGASPGVVVTLDGGNPAGGGDILIRGGASLSASNSPLIVVDGVPMDTNGITGSSNPLGLISPENIESMTILKDASATAIYGSRASNGVIIITTKKGSSKRPQVNVTANMYVNTPRNHLDVMNGDEFRDYIVNRYGADSNQAMGLGKANTDWVKEELRTSVSYDVSVSVGGTVKWLPYYVALSYTSNEGILKKSSMDRATGSINLTPTFFDDLLSLQLNLKGAIVRNNYAYNTLGTATAFNPTLPVRDYENGVPEIGYYTSYAGNGLPLTPETWTGSINETTAPINPVSRLMERYDRGTSYQSVGNFVIDLKMPFLRELRANLNLGYDFQKGKSRSYDYKNSPAAWASNSGGYNITENGAVVTKLDGGAEAWMGSQIRRNLLLDFYLNYNKEFEKANSALDVTAGYSWQKFQNLGHTWGTVNSVGNPDMEEWLGYQASPTYYYSYPHQLVSFFGRVNYTFMDRYLITATVRWDGTSRFSKQHRWGTFPSFALGWKILEEKFMERARGWMNELKIRAGYGVTGQQDLPDIYFPYLPVFTVQTDPKLQYPFGNQWLMPITPEAYNSDIKWEETHTWNAGIDFGFLNNRISGSVDFYKRTTKDLLTWANYPAGSNLTNKGNINIGDLENIGVELTLNTRPVVTNDVIWNSTLNVAWNKNKVTRLAEGADSQFGYISSGKDNTILKHEVGYAASSFYVYEQAYDENGDPLEGVVIDRNGDGTIDASDLYLYHSKDPKVTLTWSNTVNYKNWDFGIVLRSNIGNWVYNDAQTQLVFESVNTDYLLSNLLRNTHLFTEKTAETFKSDYFVQNASFLRCDNITVGYTWRNLINGNLRLRLYGAVQNPFVITKYKGLDPEVMSGIDNGVYPNPITFTLGIVATF